MQKPNFFFLMHMRKNAKFYYNKIVTFSQKKFLLLMILSANGRYQNC